MHMQILHFYIYAECSVFSPGLSLETKKNVKSSMLIKAERKFVIKQLLVMSSRDKYTDKESINIKSFQFPRCCLC